MSQWCPRRVDGPREVEGRWHRVQGGRRGTWWLKTERKAVWAQDAGGPRAAAIPATLVLVAPAWPRPPGPPGHLNRLSLCSPQLNGSGQLKLSSHCLPAQMLAPPPPGLPRLALPPAAKPTSEGGCASPTSPCKHSGSGARGRAGVPEGPSPPSRPCAQASPVGPHRETRGHVVRSLRGQGSLGGAAGRVWGLLPAR